MIFWCIIPANRRRELNEDTDRDRFMTPQEAKTYGLIDEVIVSRDGKRATTGDTPEKSSGASSA